VHGAHEPDTDHTGTDAVGHSALLGSAVAGATFNAISTFFLRSDKVNEQAT
jgi:hypothetical protein